VVYNRAASTYLRAYPSGDKTGSYVSIEIVKANHPRNADWLVLTAQAEQEDLDF
jgi:hypothetical protein